jgi:predicted aspartyl protease
VLVTALTFVNTDPLPVVRVRVNASDEVNFLIDTGASEIVLDPDFAKMVGAKTFGSVTGIFAGGNQAATVQGRIDSLTLGDFTVRNVPVSVLDTKGFTGAAGGRRIDGILGTQVLSLFVSTLDYPHQQLVLRRNQTAAVESITVPFWLAGDHYVVAEGAVNGVREMLFVDTGLAGGGFTCPQSTLKEIGVDLSTSPSATGVGGGGPLRIVPFTVKELTLGRVTEHGVSSFFGPFPAVLEMRFGFRLGGLISHAFFRNHALTFDFGAMELRLTK